MDSFRAGRTALLVSLLSCSAFAADKAPKAPKIAALKVLESYTIPALELSGMAWRKDPQTGRRQIVVVGDRDHVIHLIDWESRKKAFEVRSIDLKPVEAKGSVQLAEKTPQSQWESVFSDESGRLFIVQEFPAQILVVSAELDRIEARIDLPVAPAAGNSGGEGLMPLRNGHVLVVNEKDPLQIVEYAPKGAQAQGYELKLSIETGGAFPLPAPGSPGFGSVQTWRFHPEHEALFEDSSGVNADFAGALYLLGDQRNLIGRIGRKLKKGGGTIKLEKLWSLPSTIQQPEGMVIDGDNRPIVSIDRKKADEPNLFVLSPLR